VKDDFDYARLVERLRRWHPDRPVGELTGLVGDARGDESLYRPSTLGSARTSITEVRAGDDCPFELAYRAGSYSLQPGASVTFFMVGQRSLGTDLQLADPEQPGFVELAVPKGATLDLLCGKWEALGLTSEGPDAHVAARRERPMGAVTVGFRIVDGELAEGVEVRFRVGRTAGFRWKRLAGRKVFNVIVDPGGEGPKMRLPEPVAIRILPLDADHLDVFLPGACRPGAPVRATLRARDRFDNRAPLDGPVDVQIGETAATAYLSEGLGRIEVTPETTRMTATCQGLPGTWRSNPCVPSEGLELYFGDLHAHDSGSTAEGYPDEVYRWARDEKRLDFVSVPVQVHRYLDNEKWLLAKHFNECFLDEGRFVTLLAYEWQHSHYGDKVIHYLGGDMPYLPIDDPRYAHPTALYEALRGTDAIIISHHPGYELDLHVPGTDWDALETDVDRLVELWSMHGSSEGVDPDDRPLTGPRRPEGVMGGLRRGKRMGLVAGSDSHTGRPGGSLDDVFPHGGGLCAVWAEALTRRSLFEALRARRTYALTGSRIVLRFSVNGAAMGSELPASSRCELLAEIWAPDRVAKVQLLRNTEVIHETSPDEEVCRVEFEDTRPADDPVFYHCRVTQADGHLAVCSPVWVGEGEVR